jgi:hypothetical protein
MTPQIRQLLTFLDACIEREIDTEDLEYVAQRPGLMLSFQSLTSLRKQDEIKAASKRRRPRRPKLEVVS